MSYLLNTVIPAFALMESNRLTFQPVHLAHLCAPSDYQCKRKFPPT
nr:MAG TPA: cytidylyltransferase-like protein [Bacteriophage sp.]